MCMTCCLCMWCCTTYHPRIYSAEAEMDYHEDDEPSETAKLLQRQKQLEKFFLKQNGSFRRKPTE